MGKKRYYCDFCDKYFVDNPQTRKNHDSGLQHTTAKRAHYAQFKGIQVFLFIGAKTWIKPLVLEKLPVTMNS